MDVVEMNNLLRLRLDEVSSLGTKSYEDEEISDFLTQAQLRLVKRYASQYEKNEYARKALSKIVTGPSALEFVNSDSEDLGYPVKQDDGVYDSSPHKITSQSILFTLPENVFRVVYEEVVVDGVSLDVIPMTHDEYRSARLNKYRKPNSRKALRFDTQTYKVELSLPKATNALGHELVSPLFDGASTIVYNIRYIQNPEKIVYSQVPSERKDCYLSEFIHDEIVDEAVLIALEVSKEQRLQTFAAIKQGNNG